MQNNQIIPIRLGAVALGLGSVLMAAGIIYGNTNLHYDFANPTQTAQSLSATNYQVWAGLMIAYYIATIFGWIGLYLYLSRGRAGNIALWGMLSSVLAQAVILPCWGVWSYAAPVSGQLYLQGNQQVLTVYQTVENNTNTQAFLSLPVLLVGLVLFCVAVWQDNTLPKAAMIILAVTSLLIGPFLPIIGIIVNGVVLALAALWLAYSLWQQTTTQRVSESATFNQVVTR